MNIAQICIVRVWCSARAIKNKVGFVESQNLFIHGSKMLHGSVHTDWPSYITSCIIWLPARSALPTAFSDARSQLADGSG